MKSSNVRRWSYVMKKGLSQKYKVGSAFKNQCNSPCSQSKNKTRMINSINADKAFEKIYNSFMIKKQFSDS